ncbi:MAG: hypothetical protein M1816_002533 [Peltula sp. TS41687]|nr:MAG: hypothetical protein M1816_002533 [Peltula sp. TS41687]
MAPSVQATTTTTTTTPTTSKPLPDIWFSSFSPLRRQSQESIITSSINDGTDQHRAPDERTVKLGKTLRVLQPRLPTLLQTPLPQEILSPHITLHLFPSTHPHLPTVTGKVAYLAALWTAPVAWGRVPIVGNVKLEILSERMVKGPSVLGGSGRSAAAASAGGDERLIVRWRTIGKSTRARDITTSSSETSSSSSSFAAATPINSGQAGQRQQEQPIDKIIQFLSRGSRQNTDKVQNEATVEDDDDDDDEFTGLFIFTFDEEGRILSHTIEHVEEDGSDLNNNWDKMRVVSVTDWLLGSMKKKRKAADEEGGLAWGYCRSHAADHDGSILGRGALQQRKEGEDRRRL